MTLTAIEPNPTLPTSVNGRSKPAPAPAHLTPDQAESFNRNGILVVENALSPDEIARYLAIVDRLDRDVPATLKGQPRQPGDPLELRNAIAAAPELIDLLDHPACFPLVAQLMGPHIALTTSHVFIRPPSPAGTRADFKAIDWHRDTPSPPPAPYLTQTPWLYTKIGYFLTDLTLPDAGALRVVPGSHRYSGPAPRLDGSMDPCGTIELKVKAGSAIIFENRVLHAVGPNSSPHPRKNIYLGYCWRFLRPIDFLLQSPNLLERANPVQRQLLGDAPTSLDYYLPNVATLPLAQWLSNHSAQA